MGYAFSASPAHGARRRGVVMLMVAHGLSVALLFLLATSIHGAPDVRLERWGVARQRRSGGAVRGGHLRLDRLPGFANFGASLRFCRAVEFSPASPRWRPGIVSRRSMDCAPRRGSFWPADRAFSRVAGKHRRPTALERAPAGARPAGGAAFIGFGQVDFPIHRSRLAAERPAFE